MGKTKKHNTYKDYKVMPASGKGEPDRDWLTELIGSVFGILTILALLMGVVYFCMHLS